MSTMAEDVKKLMATAWTAKEVLQPIDSETRAT
jgi:hypothetical protein